MGEHLDAQCTSSAPTTSDGLDLLIDAATLTGRIKELAAAISADYRDRDPVLVSVLKGATLFLADLVRMMDIDLEIDFMSISSFGSSATSSGVVRIEQDLSSSIEGRHVVVIEDIVDTGLTLHYLLRVLQARGPASLHVCALFDKDVRRIVELPITYRGFSIPDTFVLGYGLDYVELYRNVAALYAVSDVDALRGTPDRFKQYLY